jgi:hypothetical protein
VQHRHDHPGYAWGALVALVIAADLTGSKTMSAAFRTCSRHPYFGPPLILGWGYLNAHLFGVLPVKYDLFHMAFCKGCVFHGDTEVARVLYDVLSTRGNDSLAR